MFARYKDNVGATVYGIYLLSIVMYAVQLILSTEAWLTSHKIDVSAVTVARVTGDARLGLGVGVMPTFLNGPNGQKTFFTGLMAA